MAEAVAAAVVSIGISLVVALPIIDYLSTSHRIRRTAAAVFATLLASLRSESRPGQKQRI